MCKSHKNAIKNSWDKTPSITDPPSTRFTTFSGKHRKKGYTWHLTHNIWQVIFYKWLMIFETWQMTGWRKVNLLSKVLGVKLFWRYFHKGWLVLFQWIGSLGRFFLKVKMSVCVSVRLFNFEVPFKCLFAPTCRSWMSKIFRDLESLGKHNGKKLSQNWKLLLIIVKLLHKNSQFFGEFCLIEQDFFIIWSSFHIGQEILCLPYAGIFSLILWIGISSFINQ